MQDSKTAAKPKAKQRVRNFQPEWLKLHTWLRFDEKTGMMTCATCLAAAGTSNSFTDGADSYRTDTLNSHATGKSHLAAIKSLEDAALKTSEQSSTTAQGSSSAQQPTPAQPSAKSLFDELQAGAKEALIKRLQVCAVTRCVR